MDVLLVQQVTGPGIRPIVPLGLLSLATTLEAAWVAPDGEREVYAQLTVARVTAAA